LSGFIFIFYSGNQVNHGNKKNSCTKSGSGTERIFEYSFWILNKEPEYLNNKSKRVRLFWIYYKGIFEYDQIRKSIKPKMNAENGFYEKLFAWCEHVNQIFFNLRQTPANVNFSTQFLIEQIAVSLDNYRIFDPIWQDF
jgi:hypothetical protein